MVSDGWRPRSPDLTTPIRQHSANNSYNNYTPRSPDLANYKPRSPDLSSASLQARQGSWQLSSASAVPIQAHQPHHNFYPSQPSAHSHLLSQQDHQQQQFYHQQPLQSPAWDRRPTYPSNSSAPPPHQHQQEHHPQHIHHIQQDNKSHSSDLMPSTRSQNIKSDPANNSSPPPSHAATPDMPPPPHKIDIRDIEVKTKFPTARIKRIMQADEDVGKVAQVAPVVMAKALELFMIRLISASADVAKSRGSKRIQTSHLKAAVKQDDQFDNLREIVDKVPDAPPKKDDDDEDEDAPAGKRRKKSNAAPRKKSRASDDDF